MENFLWWRRRALKCLSCFRFSVTLLLCIIPYTCLYFNIKLNAYACNSKHLPNTCITLKQCISLGGKLLWKNDYRLLFSSMWFSPSSPDPWCTWVAWVISKNSAAQGVVPEMSFRLVSIGPRHCFFLFFSSYPGNNPSVQLGLRAIKTIIITKVLDF